MGGLMSDAAAAMKRIEEALAMPPWPILARQQLTEHGCRLVAAGDRRWFSTDEWHADSVIGLRRRDAYVALLMAIRPGHGAFNRLLAALNRERYRPAIIAPLPVMESILRHKGFSPTREMIAGEACDVWRA
jgi:hypothetical protein